MSDSDMDIEKNYPISSWTLVFDYLFFIQCLSRSSYITWYPNSSAIYIFNPEQTHPPQSRPSNILIITLTMSHIITPPPSPQSPKYWSTRDSQSPTN